MTVFDVQRFSLHDGPGIRTTVFLKGCPLRCLWCQNPEGLEFGPEDAGGRGKVRTLTPAELADELMADQVFFDTSGGGVTFSGGEPLAQADELVATARLLRSRGVHVAVETSLQAPREAVLGVAAEVDLVLADLKAARADDHRAWTGQGNERVLGNFAALIDASRSAGKPAVVARTPLVPGHTATDANLAALRAFLERWSPRPAWELLDFNPLAQAKYAGLGRAYPFAHVSSGLGADELARLARVAGLATTPEQETTP